MRMTWQTILLWPMCSGNREKGGECKGRGVGAVIAMQRQKNISSGREIGPNKNLLEGVVGSGVGSDLAMRLASRGVRI